MALAVRFLFVVMIGINECHVENLIVTRTNTNQGDRIKLKSENTKNLRIHTVYDGKLNQSKYFNDIKQFAIDPVVSFIEGALRPKVPMVKPLIIDMICSQEMEGTEKKTCFERCENKIESMVIPDKYLSKCNYMSSTYQFASYGEDGEGSENTDFLLFLSSGPCKKDVLAFSQYVTVDKDTDRPVAALIQLCDVLLTKEWNVPEQRGFLQSTILHEIVHTLGFASPLFAFFRDENGQPRTARDRNGNPNNGKILLDGYTLYKPSNNTFIQFEKPVISRLKNYTKTVAMLLTPALTREAKKHFGCQSLNGIFLEDYGSKANAYSHFESNYFQDELMTSRMSSKANVSRFTMALLEDSGWYHVNYDKAEHYEYGKNVGCDFLNKSCFEFISERRQSGHPIYPYCDQENETKCSESKTEIEMCPLSKINDTSVPKENRYFLDESLIGHDAAVDYCPIFIKRSLPDGMTCMTDKAEILLKGPPLNYLTENKNCLKSAKDKIWTIYNVNDSMSIIIHNHSCYKYNCSSYYGLTVTVCNKEYICEYDGQEKIIEYKMSNEVILKGIFVCPECETFCQDNDCYGSEPSDVVIAKTI